MEFFFNRKDKLLSKCNNCLNNVPQPPKKFKKKKRKKETGKLGFFSYRIGSMLSPVQVIFTPTMG